jgi:hypothetical protein
MESAQTSTADITEIFEKFGPKRPRVGHSRMEGLCDGNNAGSFIGTLCVEGAFGKGEMILFLCSMFINKFK